VAVDVNSRALEPGTVYRFQLSLALGTVAPVALPLRIGDVAAGVRHAGDQLARRADAVADVLSRLGERRWRTVDVAPIGRDVLAPHGFTGLDGSALPEVVSAVKEATPEEVARDLAEAGGDLRGELFESLAVRVDDLDIPARVGSGEPALRYSPREYLETFSIRG
jgi:hypothetical protein